MRTTRGMWLLVFALGGLVTTTAFGQARQHVQNLVARQEPSGKIAGWNWHCENGETKVGDVWRLVDGVLICKGTPKGYLYTDASYQDFELRLEWRWPPAKKPGNGGVLVRMVGPHKIWPRSLEAQINVGDAGDFWGLDGFPLAGPADRCKKLEHPQYGKLTNLRKTASAEKPPGQWNRYVIVVDSGTVTLKINGQQVNRATGCPKISGSICLTAEGDEIHFRNVRLIPRT